MKNYLNKIKRSLRGKKKGKRTSPQSLFSPRFKARGKRTSSNALKKLFRKGVLFTVLFVLMIGIVGWSVFCLWKFATFETKRAFRDEGTKVDEWRNDGRINIALLGMDKREGEYGYVDAIMVLMIDPVEKHVGLFDVNVDSTVYILKYKRSFTLRTLYNWGALENDEIPVRLLLDGVERLLSIRINRYIMVDEEKMSSLADSVGGVYVENESKFTDKDISINAGIFSLDKGGYRLDGEKYLGFMQADDDGTESKLSRQIIATKGFLRRSASFYILLRLPAFIDQMKGVYTDMNKSELLHIASQIMFSNELSSAYTSDAAFQSGSIDGKKALYPVFEQLDKDIQLVFIDSRVGKEQARVEVFNGTNIQGFGTFRARWLKNIGVDVIRVGDATGEFPQTTIYATDKVLYQNTIDTIQRTFGEDITILQELPDFITTGDVIVVIGANASR